MRKTVFLTIASLFVAVTPSLAQTSRTGDDGPIEGYGTAVAVTGSDVLVAEPQFTDKPGVVYLYRRGADGTWSHAQELRAANGTADNRFGRAIAADGDRAVFGATKQDDDRGAAYIFERDGAGVWREVVRLVPNDVEGIQNFGRAVALSGEIAIVGSAAYGDNRGAAWVFRRAANGQWSEEAMLLAPGGVPQDLFGLTVALEGELAVVGTPAKDNNSGAAWAFRYSDGAWSEAGRLEAPGLQAQAQFATDIEVHMGHVIVGAPGMNGFIGAVYVFAPADDGAWSVMQTLHPFDGQRGHRFGSAVAHGQHQIWATAPGADEASGRVYVISGESESHELVKVEKVRVDDVLPRDLSGTALAVTAEIAAVAIQNDDYGLGSVAILEHGEDGWRHASKLWVEVEPMDPVLGGQVDCDQGTAARFDCSAVDLLSFLPVSAMGGTRGVEVNDVWGWTDPDTQREYALVGRYDGTSIVDITDPLNPVYVGNLPLHAGAWGNVWRDIKVYEDHAFIVSDGAGPHGMQVFDLRQLRGVRNAPVEFTETAHYDRINSAHNIVINEETGFAYSVGSSQGGETCGGGLHMIDIREPGNPTFAGCFADATTGRRKTGYSHDAQCLLYDGPDMTYRGHEICFGANETALSIADVTDKSNPVAVSMAEYPNVGYSHQGWISEDHRYFFMNDELDELQGKVTGTRTLVWDITDLDDPILASEFYGTTEASDHNLYVRDNLMYQSHYFAGVRIVDVSDPVNPREIGYFDTVPGDNNKPGFGGSWSNYPYFKSGVLVVTSGREGMFVLKKKETLIP